MGLGWWGGVGCNNVCCHDRKSWSRRSCNAFRRQADVALRGLMMVPTPTKLPPFIRSGPNPFVFFQVKHTKSQFTKTIRKRCNVKKAGTQQCDRIWEHVKKSIPKIIKSRGSDGFVNTDTMLSYWHHAIVCMCFVVAQKVTATTVERFGSVMQKAWRKKTLRKHFGDKTATKCR